MTAEDSLKLTVLGVAVVLWYIWLRPKMGGRK